MVAGPQRMQDPLKPSLSRRLGLNLRIYGPAGAGDAVLTTRRQTASVHSSFKLVHEQASPYLDRGGVRDTLHYPSPSFTQACTAQIAGRSNSLILSPEGDNSPSREGGQSSCLAVSGFSHCVLREHVSGPENQRDLQADWDMLAFQNGDYSIAMHSCSFTGLVLLHRPTGHVLACNDSPHFEQVPALAVSPTEVYHFRTLQFSGVGGQCRQVVSHSQSSLSQLGLLNLLAPLVALGHLHLRPLQFWLSQHSDHSLLYIDWPVEVTSNPRNALEIWTDTVWLLQRVPLISLSPDCYLFHGQFVGRVGRPSVV